MDVADWLRTLGLAQYETAFRENDVSAELLARLTGEDLKEIGVSSVGHRRRLLEAIAALPSEPAGPAHTAEFPPERRQVTMLFCDLVGSTALSTRLDPEELRRVLSDYQATTAAAVASKRGHLAHLIGDGVLAYFGWPNADEAQAESAVRCAFAVIAAVRPLNLAVRIAIATGLVVVGDLIGAGSAQEFSAIGETPNLAARLQVLAAPDAIVVSDATRALLSPLFEFRDLGLQNLKGFELPQRAWKVERNTALVSRSEALYGGAHTALIGRDEELDLLLRRWQRAKSGEGCTVLLSGEPGIGKSRLLAALEARLGAEPHASLRYFCSPHHQDSPLYPIIARWEQEAGFASGDTAEERLRKLETVVAPQGLAPEDVALLATMLSIPAAGRYTPPDLGPQQRRERIFGALTQRLARLAHAQPVLLLFEDAHWADPSSLELLTATIGRLAELPVLLVISFRLEFAAPWIGHPGVSLIALSRLDRRRSAALAAQVMAGHVLSAALTERIVAQTDGVPLSIEELTKAVLEGPEGLDAVARSLAVPATLQASLMARLDRLPAAKQVAQIGAVIGREFAHALLASIAALPDTRLAQGLDELVGAGLAFRRGVAPDTVYAFKHALVQDAAYESLLKSQRAAIHARIVAALIARQPGIEDTQPDLLAHHCEHGGLAERAVNYYTRSAGRSAASGAIAEMRDHLCNAMRLIATLPEGPSRDRMELDALLGLSDGVLYETGHTTAEADDLNARMIELWEKLGRPSDYVHARSGQVLTLLHRSDVQRVRNAADSLLRSSHGASGAQGRFLGNLFAGGAEMLGGEFPEARARLEAVLGSREFLLSEQSVPPDRPWTPDAPYLVHRTTAQAWLAFVMCWLGYPDQGLTHACAAVERARHRSDVRDIFWCLLRHVELLSFLGELSKVETLLPELTGITREHEFPFYRARVRIMEGDVLACRGDPEKGRSLVAEGIASWAASGATMYAARYSALLAETHRMLGDTEAALRILREGLDLAERTGEMWYAAELHRRMGEVHRQRGDDDAAAVCFARALAVADRQNAMLWKLQAAASNARLLRDQGRRAEARAQLAPVHAWFTEGFGTPVLQDARTLLEELGGV